MILNKEKEKDIRKWKVVNKTVKKEWTLGGIRMSCNKKYLEKN